MNSGVILSCVYDDWAAAELLFQAIDREFSQRQWKWQLVLVDDGSRASQPPDFLKSLISFSSVEVVALRRNVGNQRAIAIGLSHIVETKTADAVVVMDADGEDQPKDLVRLIEAYAAQGPQKIIFAERTRRSERFLFRLLYQAYRAFHYSLTGYKIRFGNFSIVPHKWVGCLVVDPNLWLHFAATVVSARIPFTTIPTRRGVRLDGKSKLNFTNLVIHGLAAISCYNEVVGVRLIFCALGLSAMIFALLLEVLVIRLATPMAMPGWATSAVGIFCVLLSQAFLVILAFIAMAISSRKSTFSSRSSNTKSSSTKSARSADEILSFRAALFRVSCLPLNSRKSCLASLSGLLLLAATPSWSQAVPTADEMIAKVVARDKVLVERRKTFDYDVEITREKLDSDKKVVSSTKESSTVVGDNRPDYGTRPASTNPEQEAKTTSREEPFELLKIIDHFNYKLEGEETVDGVDCYKIAFTPKDDMPYDNREEKVLNNVSGHIWASTLDYSVIKNEGSLLRPVSVAWIFASLREMEFHFDAMRMPNGDYGPGHLMYRYRVSIPFTELHERDIRVMSNYRAAGT